MRAVADGYVGRWPVVVALVLAATLVTPAAAAPAAEPDTVEVFFSHDPESFDNPLAVFPLSREVPADQLMEGAVAALIDGPSADEQANGYFSDFKAVIVGTTSTCKGQDFVLMHAQGVVTLQLCRQALSAGELQDGRVLAEVDATLRQFPGVTKVIVLDTMGHCLFDLTGFDPCLT